MLAENDDTLPDDDDDVKLTREGWDDRGCDREARIQADLDERDRDYGDWLEEQERQTRTLRDWARYTLETGDTRCCCRDGLRCQRCRVHEIVYSERMVREFKMGEVPF